MQLQASPLHSAAEDIHIHFLGCATNGTVVPTHSEKGIEGVVSGSFLFSWVVNYQHALIC